MYLPLTIKKVWNISVKYTNIFHKSCLFAIIVLFDENFLLFNRKNNFWTLFYFNISFWFVYVVNIFIKNILFFNSVFKSLKLFNEFVWIFRIHIFSINWSRKFRVNTRISLKKVIILTVINSNYTVSYS
jgi:hypothetical protein